MDDIKEALADEFQDKDARRQYAIDFLNSHIALQIKTLRQQRGWSQTELAERAGKHQSQVSAMESIDFSAWKISTLQKLAEAFDLALTVKFESFGGFLDYATSVDREALERPSFADDPAFQPGEQAPDQVKSSEPATPRTVAAKMHES
jgi:transcriptional regulator with XRE-family HTH domain